MRATRWISHPTEDENSEKDDGETERETADVPWILKSKFRVSESTSIPPPGAFRIVAEDTVALCAPRAAPHGVSLHSHTIYLDGRLFREGWGYAQRTVWTLQHYVALIEPHPAGHGIRVPDIEAHLPASRPHLRDNLVQYLELKTIRLFTPPSSAALIQPTRV